ncbi:MAG: SoxR reducing system RseC family protein [Candidatus Marinimicrobia bacterium]|nr:SoxR reducing system RseC family protein [Candidatus Neomarinimicrobiota bacterium]
MPTNGIITDKKDGKVYIRIEEDTSACSGCAAHALCGKKDCSDAQVILNDRSDLHVNDEVEIEEKENILIKTSLLAYGVPLVFFVAGVLLGNLIPETALPKELLQFLSGCLGLLVGGLLGRHLAKRLSQSIDKYFSINVKNQQQ